MKTKNSIKPIVCLCLAVASVFLSVLLLWQVSPIYTSALGSSAKAMCVLDKDSHRILYSKNANEQLPMASTTKVVTAITAIENCKDLDEVITVNNNAVGVEGTSI